MAIKIKSGIKFEGELIAKNLKNFIIETESAAGNILEEGAEILKREARGRVAGPTGRKSGKYPHPPGTLKDSIDIGWVYHGKGKVGIKVGIAENEYFTQEDKFYARFIEFGTQKMLAQPFMRPTLVKSRAKIRKLVIERLRKEMGFE